MKAIAISNFPVDFNEGKFRPEFEARHVHDVEFITGPDFKNYKIGEEIHTVFCFFDLMSHNQHDVAKSLTKKAKKRFVLLNRKASGWPSEPFEAFQPIQSEPAKGEVSMAAPKSVSNENLDAMVKQYISLVDSGMDEEHSVLTLSKYWTGRPLTSFLQAKNYVARLVMTNDAPQFYLDWLQNRTRTVPVADATLVHNAEVETPITNTETQAPVDDSIPVQHEEVVKDSQEMLKLYEEENAALTCKVQDLQNEILGLRREIEKQNKEIQSRNGDKVKKVLSALRTLMEAGVITTEEAFDKISKVI
jgi:hypothetical protein